MKAHNGIGLLYVAMLMLQGCGMEIKAKAYETAPTDYVTFEIYEYDRVTRRKTRLATECVPLDRDWQDGEMNISDNYGEDLNFNWSLRGEKITFTFEDQNIVLSEMDYETDFFLDGSEAQHRIVTSRGYTYIVELAGPDCVRA